MGVPRPMTKEVLLSAFGGESMAHMRYLFFSKVAVREGFHNVARLFRAVAYAEEVHASNHYSKLGGFDEDASVNAGSPIGPGDTLKNLELAIRGEEFEVNEMYPAYIEVARHQGEKEAEISFRWALEAEKIHAELFKEAKSFVEKKEDWRLESYIWICPVCGYTHVGYEPPEKCPVCGASGSSFKEF